MNIQDPEFRYQRAKEKVAAMKDFYMNLLAYCIVIPMLIFLNYRTSTFPWVIFPAVGWGIGLICHGLSAFEYRPFFGKDWESRKIREIMAEDTK